MTAHDDFFWDGYLHWARKIEESRPPGAPTLFNKADAQNQTVYEPVFIQMRKITDKATLETIKASLVSGPIEDIYAIAPFGFLADVVFDPLDLLVACENSYKAGIPLEFFIYRKIARTAAQHDPGDLPYHILDVGAPAVAWPNPPLVKVDREAQGLFIYAIGAVIDNDIGFLNRRFRDSSNNTRFAGIWLQARERFIPQNGHGATSGTPKGTSVHIGRVLTGLEIQDYIDRSDLDEADAYHQINSELHEFDLFKRVPPVATHGTAVADVAFGSGDDRDALVMPVPLLAVQLPPEAALDTSGTYSESYIIQGIRWLCLQARSIDETVPLIINLSYGVLAGQKDGGKFLEAQIAREIENAKHIGQTVKVVIAYGNSYNARLVAKLCLAPNVPQTLDWVVYPDNGFPCFMEIRRLLDGALTSIPAGVSLCLTSPSGDSVVTDTNSPGQAEPGLGTQPDMPPCRVYHVPARAMPDGHPDQPGYLNVALAPTQPFSDDIGPAEPGTWTLELENTSADTIDLVLQIQRGDTAPGFSVGGRQSHFDGAFVETVEDGFPAKTVTAPLTNKGTNSAYTTSAHPNIITVGARRAVLGHELRAEYASQGAKWSGGQTADVHHVVDGLTTRGVLASGTFSGTTTRLSGSSAAAALETRKRLSGK